MAGDMHEHRIVKVRSPPQDDFATPATIAIAPQEIATSDVLFQVYHRDTTNISGAALYAKKYVCFAASKFIPVKETNLDRSLCTGGTSWYRRVLPTFCNPRNLLNAATALWAFADEVVNGERHCDAATTL